MSGQREREGQGEARFTAFSGQRRIASGTLTDVAAEAKRASDADERAWVFIFNDETGQRVDIDFRGSVDDVLSGLPSVVPTSADAANAASETSPGPRGPGRPKLGVVAREVTLLPRHWDWLNRQPGGASVALRRLVDEARTLNVGRDVRRQAREAAYRFMSAMAGDNVGFEEATRCLFAGNARGFEEHTASWDADVREYARQLAAPSFGAE